MSQPPLNKTFLVRLYGEFPRGGDEPIGAIDKSEKRMLSQNVLISSATNDLSQEYQRLAWHHHLVNCFFSHYFQLRSFTPHAQLISCYYRVMRYEKNALYNVDNAFRCGSGSRSSFFFGQGYSSLGIVAHEFTHAVTGYMTYADHSELFYNGEAGAIHEGFSDVFAYIILHSYLPETATGDQRWEFEGARNADDPHKHGQPAYYGEPGYWISPQNFFRDRGGVHRNNSIMTRLARLICDGGTFDGITIRGVGESKMATLFWTVLSSRRIPVNAEFRDIAGLLQWASRKLNFSTEEKEDIVNACRVMRIPTNAANAASQQKWRELRMQMNLAENMPLPQLQLQHNRISSLILQPGYSIKLPNGDRQQAIDQWVRTMQNSLSSSSAPLEYVHCRIDGNNEQLLQRHRGIPVFGASLLLGFDDDGGISYVRNSLSGDLSRIDPNGNTVSQAQAQNLFAQMAKGEDVGNPEKVVFDPAIVNQNGAPQLAWMAVSTVGDQIPFRRYIISAETGKLLFQLDLFQTP